MSGELYTVPVGLRVHCIKCGATLEAGSQCWIEDDSSSIYCTKCAPLSKPKVEKEPEPEPIWMAYE